MMKPSKIVLGALVFGLGASACKQRQDTSDVKHVFGQTARPGEKRAACDQDKQKNFDLVVDTYLRDLMEYIAAANPQTFKGQLDVSNICINGSKEAIINAHAQPGTQRVVVDAGLLLAASNDAQVATVVAHELAHVTMQGEHREEVPPAVAEHPDWAKFKESYDTRCSKLSLDAASLVAENGDPFVAAMQTATIFVDAVSPELRKRHAEVLNEFLKISNGVMSHPQIAPLDRSTLFQKLGPIPEPEPREQEGDVPAIGARAFDGDPDEDVKIKVSNPEIITKATASIEAWNKKAAELLKDLQEAAPEEYKEWRDARERMAEIDKKGSVIFARMQLLDDEFTQFIETIAGQNTRYNWREAQADEVGYELFLRAKFDPNETVWYAKRKLGPEQWEKCLNEHIKPGKAPGRFDQTHPAACWRAYNYLYLEPKVHADHYASLFKAAKVTTAIDGGLDEVKKVLTEKHKVVLK